MSALLAAGCARSSRQGVSVVPTQALATRTAETIFRRYFGGHAYVKNGHPVQSIVNLVTGERHALEWGGVRLTIDPAADPALLFRCES